MPIPLIPALSVAARFLASKGATKAITKYGRKAVEAAKKEISKYTKSKPDWDGRKAYEAAQKEINKRPTTKSKPDAIARAKKEKRIEQKVRNRQPGRSGLSKGTEDTLGKAILGTGATATGGIMAGALYSADQAGKRRGREAKARAREEERAAWDAKVRARGEERNDASKASKAKASGGPIKSYTRGGGVRGAGKAIKGSRPCKMR